MVWPENIDSGHSNFKLDDRSGRSYHNVAHLHIYARSPNPTLRASPVQSQAALARSFLATHHRDEGPNSISLKCEGYLDPDLRGEPADECDAIETFLSDSLTKSR
jgi:hypothetical protein